MRLTFGETGTELRANNVAWVWVSLLLRKQQSCRCCFPVLGRFIACAEEMRISDCGMRQRSLEVVWRL